MMKLIARIVLALACLLPLSALAQTSGTGRGEPVFPVADWPQNCWPSKATDVVTVETEYGWINAWWCADGTWRSIVRPKAPTVDALQAAYLEAAAQPLLDKIKPVVPVWVVAPNGTSATRPVYRLEGDKLFTSSARVSILQPDGTPTPCNCTLGRYSVSTTSTYCAIPQAATAQPLLVAICKAK